jgi:hypothetical protein
MREAGLRGRALIAALTLFAGLSSARAEMLAPFKDDLFALPAVIETSDGGSRVVVDYQEMRDINGRDEVPERRAHPRYVDLSVRRSQAELAIEANGRTLPHFAVGATANARFVVLYLHGQGGNRRQGVDDFTFGGNFNRIRNLAAANGGLYLTLDLRDFGRTGTADAKALLEFYLGRSPGSEAFVACGSAGGAVCWALARDSGVAPRLGGILLLGSMWDDGFVSSPAFAAGVPVYLGHGSNDRVFAVDRQETFLRGVLARRGDYPIRMVRFETGSHGTPIRMTDWRGVLNWMAAR